MKKGFFVLMLLSFCRPVFSQEKAPQYVRFLGTTDTMYNGSMVVLYNRATNDHDSAEIKDGHFEIKVLYKEPTRYMFYSKYEIKKKGGYAPFGILVTGPGEISMKTDMETFGRTVVSGAPENALYNEYAAVGNAMAQKMRDEMALKYGKDFSNRPDPKDPRYKQLVADYDSMNAANQPAETERLEKFLAKNPGSLASMYILSSAASTLGGAKTEELYNKLGSTYKTSTYAQRIVSVVEACKKTAIGSIAPDFEQPDTSGKLVKLSALRGKYLLVDFWASWCGPCRQENPNLVKAFSQYKDKGFSVLGVSLDQPGKKEAWLAAIHKDNLTWTQVSDLKYWDNAVAKLYGIDYIPQNYLLDPNGKIIASNIRGEELNKKLSELFKL